MEEHGSSLTSELRLTIREWHKAVAPDVVECQGVLVICFRISRLISEVKELQRQSQFQPPAGQRLQSAEEENDCLWQLTADIREALCCTDILLIAVNEGSLAENILH